MTARPPPARAAKHAAKKAKRDTRSIFGVRSDGTIREFIFADFKNMAECHAAAQAWAMNDPWLKAYNKRRAKRAAKQTPSTQHLDASRAATTCPDCGDTGPHDDNGATRRDELAYSCRACGMCFDAER